VAALTCSAIEGLGLGVTALGSIESGDIREGRSNARVLGPKRLLENSERSAIERLGVGIAALSATDPRELVEGCGHLQVLGPERLFPDRERSAIERLGLGIAASLTERETRRLQQGEDRPASVRGRACTNR
jgi:hypothetical protein